MKDARRSGRRGTGGPTKGRRRRNLWLVAATLLAVLAATGPGHANDGEQIRVTNHLFAERVIQTADGGYVVQEVIVGFERGVHSFETLTQIVLTQGEHDVQIALADPEGVELERLKFGVLTAPRDGWTQSLRGLWRGVRFGEAGMHQLLVYRAGVVVARFFFTVA